MSAQGTVKATKTALEVRRIRIAAQQLKYGKGTGNIIQCNFDFFLNGA